MRLLLLLLLLLWILLVWLLLVMLAKTGTADGGAADDVRVLRLHWIAGGVEAGSRVGNARQRVTTAPSTGAP